LAVPTIPCGRQTLYFFPDRLFVYDRRSVGAVAYKELHLESGDSRFIEEGAVPRDASQVGTTWKFVNRTGGPDRRFNNNRELPILLYGTVGFRSASGLNELIECSRSAAAVTFVNAEAEWQGTGVQQAAETPTKAPSANGHGSWYVVVDAPDVTVKQRASAILKKIEPGIPDSEIASYLGGGKAPTGGAMSLERANALMLALELAGIAARKYRAPS
jgi:hypothetical protein